MVALPAHAPIRRPLLVVALALSACTARDGRPVLVPLQYEQKLSKADFPNPMVRLTFNERTAWFVVDTGAGVHTVTQWFADAASMQIHESLAGAVHAVDSTGQAVAFRSVRDQVGRLRDHKRVRIEVALVAPFPPEFEASGVAGLVNPQLLATEGEAAAFDLRVPELRFESFDRALRRLGARVVPSDQVRVCGATETDVPNLLFAVRTKTPYGEGWMQLDSGASETTVVRASALARGVTLESGGESVGVGGQRRQYLRARGLAMSFADQQFSLDARIVETTGEGCGPDGLLGLDAMRRCAFVFGGRSLALVCSS